MTDIVSRLIEFFIVIFLIFIILKYFLSNYIKKSINAKKMQNDSKEKEIKYMKKYIKDVHKLQRFFYLWDMSTYYTF